MKYCVNCGEEIDPRAEICPHCGVRQPGMATGSGAITSRIVAALFAILLGSFGIHKFYLGQIGWGIVYIIFSWTGIPAIVGVIEGIIYLTYSDEEFTLRYNR
ncbi:MAG: NINE protein [bacterium]